MDLMKSKWLRTAFWLIATTICTYAIMVQPIIKSPVVWIILTIYCIWNTYLEYIVSALFISPGTPKPSFESLEWDSHHLKFQSVTTHIQTFQQKNTAPLIVFIHGWRSSSASVFDRAQWFAEKGWHVAICELPGHGQSSPIPRWTALTASKHMKYHIKNLDNIIETKKVSHFFFYGHSMGGYICTRLSSHSNNIPYNIPLSGLILESPLMLYSKIFEEISNQLKIPSAIRPFHLSRVFRDIRSMLPPHAQDNRLAQFDVPEWGVPLAPTLCLQAKTDSRLGREHYDAAVSSFSGEIQLTHHLIESLPHSGAKTNSEREKLLIQWLETFDSLLLR